jgi:hypothetical protein
MAQRVNDRRGATSQRTSGQRVNECARSPREFVQLVEHNLPSVAECKSP